MDMNTIIEELATSLERRTLCHDKASLENTAIHTDKEKYREVNFSSVEDINKSAEEFRKRELLVRNYQSMAKGYNYELEVAAQFFQGLNVSGYSLLWPSLPIIIRADGTRLNDDMEYVPYKNICGKMVECPFEMTAEEYHNLYEKTFIEMRERRELTDEIITMVTTEKVNEAYQQKFTTNRYDNFRIQHRSSR